MFAAHDAEDAARLADVKSLLDAVSAGLVREGDLSAALFSLQAKYDAAIALLSSLQAKYDAYVVSHPAAPPKAATLFGWWATPAADTALRSVVGPAQMYRHFPGAALPATFVGTRADTARLPVHLSFKAAPIEVLAGTWDTRIKAYFASIPADRLVWWSYWHEPEDEIQRGDFSAADYRAAWVRILGLIPKRDTLRPTLTLMAYSFNAGGRTLDTYLDAAMLSAGLKVLAFDAYQSGQVPTVQGQLDVCVALAKQYGLGWAIPETGVFKSVLGVRETAVASWVLAVANYAKANGAEFLSWFEQDNSTINSPTEADFRISPLPAAVSAWRSSTT